MRRAYLSRVIGFTPLQQTPSEAMEFFVYGKTSAGSLRSTFLPAETAEASEQSRAQLRALLLAEALRQSLGEEPGRVTAAPSAADAGSWTNLSDLRATWNWVGPEVCAATSTCWDRSKEANLFTVTADFYKLPDGRVDTDYYLIEVTSSHSANYKVAYQQQIHGCSDGWVGWFALERALKLEGKDQASKLYEYAPTGTLSQQTITYTLGASLETKALGVNGSYSSSYTNSDAKIIDTSSIRDNYANWRETFLGYRTAGLSADPPSSIARSTFSSKRAAIFQTTNPAGGIRLQLSPTAIFHKVRRDFESLCALRHVTHKYTLGDPREVTVRKNFAPERPAMPSLTIPAGSTAYWTNTPLTVDVPATTDRDGDTLTYSVDFGDGTIGSFGAAKQTHSWPNPGQIRLKAKARDMHGDTSDWSDSSTYTIKGLDRIEIEGLGEIPEGASMPLQRRAFMSDNSTRMVTPDGWEGGAIQWSVNSPYASISSNGVLQALSAQGADRIVNVTAVYRLKGIEKSASRPILVRRSTTAPAITSVVNGACFRPGISPSTWTTVYGTNLAASTRSWRNDEIVNGNLPTVLDGVSVTMNGRAAAISYISPAQLNVQAPSGLAPGLVAVRVTTPQGTAEATAQMGSFSPPMFTMGGKTVAALHADYSYVGRPGQFGSVPASPARPGETVLLYGAGFGPSDPEVPAGRLVTTPAPLASPVNVWIGDRAAEVQWKGVSGAGLWQLNVVVPHDLPDGDATVAAEAGGLRTQPGILIPVQR